MRALPPLSLALVLVVAAAALPLAGSSDEPDQSNLTVELRWDRRVPDDGIHNSEVVLFGKTNAPSGTQVRCTITNAAYNQKQKAKLFYQKWIGPVRGGKYEATFDVTGISTGDVTIAARVFADNGQIVAEEVQCIRINACRRVREFPKRGKLTRNVEVAKATVKFNVIGNPEAHLVLYNGRAKPIDACTVHIYCYNNYDEPVRHYGHGSNRFTGISQRLLKSREYTTAVWTLHGYQNTTKITAKVARWHVKED